MTLLRYHQKTPLSCVVNLGDIIDGHDGEREDEALLAKEKQDLKVVLEILENLNLPKYL